MAANRIRRHASPFSNAVPKSLMQSQTPAIPSGFVLYPTQLVSLTAWQQEIYRLAYERARAETQVPRHHRLLFAVWN
jgi:hypothetical protein